MARLQPTELSGSMAVLGLLIERPNQTVTEIARALDRRFTRARFAPSTAHNALRQMAEGKRKRVSCTHVEPGDERTEDRYEATIAGLEDYELWMCTMPGTLPALRDAVYGRIELCLPKHLPMLIKMAQREAAIADDLYQETARRLATHRKRKAEPRDFAREIREVVVCVEPKRWADRAEAYKMLAKRLEELYDEIMLSAPELLRD
jgi:DNA-binding PadR family transcriptional regulator